MMEKWYEWFVFVISLYFVYMLVGGLIVFWRLLVFLWFVKRGLDFYSVVLGIIMFLMGFIMCIEDLFYVFIKWFVVVICFFVL